MAHRDRPRQASSLAVCLLGMVMSLLMTACATQASSQTTMPPSPTTPPTPITPQQAWGNYPATHISLPLATTKSFAPMDIFPDGSAIAGVGGQNGQMQVMLVQVATSDTRVLYTAPPDLSTTFQVQTDGRFVAWAGGNEGEGATSERNIVGYSDVQTGQVTMLADANHYVEILQLIHGTLVWRTATNDPTKTATLATDLATNTTTTLPITQEWNCNRGSWPYLLCEENNGLVFWELYNLTTHQVTTPTSLGRLTQGTSGYVVALDGTTAFLLPAGGYSSPQPAHPAQLIEIDQIDQPSATSHGLSLTFVANTLMANGRLVVWTGNRDGSGPTNQLYAWDRAQNRLIAFDPQQFQNMPQLVVRDHTVMIARNFGDGQGDMTVIDTDTLPKA